MEATRDLIFVIVGTAVITARIIAELIARAGDSSPSTQPRPAPQPRAMLRHLAIDDHEQPRSPSAVVWIIAGSWWRDLPQVVGASADERP